MGGSSANSSSDQQCSANSAAGNSTRVFRVTGGNTNHYTTADLQRQLVEYLKALT